MRGVISASLFAYTNAVQDPSSEKVESPFRRSPRGSPNRNSTATPNGGTAAEAAQRESSSNASGPPILLHAEPSADDRTEEATETETNGTGVLTVANEAQNTTPESRTHTPFASGSRDTALENIRQSTDISQETQLAEQRELAESSPKKAAKVAQDRSAKRASPNSLSPRPPRGKISKTAATRKRGASNDAPDSGQGSTSASTHSSEVEADLVESAEQNERAQRPSRTTRKSTRGGGEITNVGSEAAKAKGPRGRASLGKPAGAIEIRQASPGEPTNEATEETSGPKTRKERQATKKADARPDPEVEARERHDSPSETAQASSKTAKQSKRSARKAKKAQSQTEREPEPEIEDEAELEHPEEPEPEPQPGPSKPRRGRSTKKAKRATETQATARIEQPGAPPEPEIEAEPESAAPSGPSKSRRTVGRRAHEATEPQTADTEEQPEQADAAPRRSTRKTREPRGETVPVTVHRLANISVFEASHVDPGEDGRDSGDEPSAHQKTKLPSRGGVNPADVLSQICRETLEKTLATLKNGIDNETNQNKRAEWTRKRKAVEAFSAELDGRLLDLSEMLDSNFVLGVQLKKSKRDMMDLRGHLYKVRKERESVALQMDAVRAKHMEEENAKTVGLSFRTSLSTCQLTRLRLA